MRAVGSSVMAVLVVLALFWGNCFSCPQVLSQASHGCCHHSKAPNTKCQTRVLQHFVKADVQQGHAPVAATAANSATDQLEVWAEAPVRIAAEPAPPGLSSLQALRI